MQGFHKRSINTFPLPRLTQLCTHSCPNLFPNVSIELAVFHEQQHHVRSNFLRSEGRNSNWNLYQLVEIIRHQQFIWHALKMLPHRVLDHLIVGSNYERRSF
ncbi:hypothetical protein DO70_1145 [Burkholderia pseudomallei]|nr:hypothetical protein DO70_1145 [Burkholderia pseudomallei]